MSARPHAGLLLLLTAALATVWLTSLPVSSQQTTAVDVAIFQDLSWRSLGPFRAGRTTAAAVGAAEPGVFYTGVEGAGLWKTTDYGRTWQSIFEAPPYGSVGAVAVSTSQPDTMYVGTGDARSLAAATTGSGLYKTTDGGRTWTAIGLSTTQRIAAIAVDPRDANRLWVAVQGAVPGPIAERGIYRSTNGGASFDRVLFVDDQTGATGILLDPGNSSVVYATLVASAQAGHGGLFKSIDGGATWRRLSSGLPAGGDLRDASLAIAPSAPRRLAASVRARVGSGLYRSDDGGELWTLVNATVALSPPDGPPAAILISPTRPDTWLIARGDAWTSIDAGTTVARWARQPADREDDVLVQSASSPGVLLLGGLHGAIVTVNDGQSWSSPFTQPTAAVTHVATDTSFPYRVCGPQQYQGPVCVPSRVERDRLGLPQWQPLPLPRDGMVVSDPAEPDIVYGGGVTRFDRRTSQTQEAAPPGMSSTLGETPLAFSPDGRTLYAAQHVVWRVATGSPAWTNIGPDLSRAGSTDEPTVSTLTVSWLDPRVLWIASTDSLARATRDGGSTWLPVTPSGLAPGSTILGIEASHFDANSAYLSATAAGPGGPPQLLRTRDFGATWTPLAIGDMPRVSVVREDPFRRGLLFAGTDRSVFLSFDDGDSWQPLRLNLPLTPITDITIRDATVIIATAGRGFWALDDISPLRQMTGDIARASAFLFRPAPVWRMRAVASSARSGDAPAPDAAPDGATLPYLIGAGARGPATLEIIETGTGTVVRQFAGQIGAARPDQLAPDQMPLDARPGLHRVVWDLRYATSVAGHGVRGPQVAPGTYQVRLTVGGRALRQAVVIRMDPRVKATATDLAAQMKLAVAINSKLLQADRGAGVTSASPSARQGLLSPVLAELARLAERVQAVDARPAAALEAAAADAIAGADVALAGAP